MSSKGKLGLNLFEKNLKRHPSVKGLFDDQGNKKSASNSKNEFLILNTTNKNNDLNNNQTDELNKKLKDLEKDEEKENNIDSKEIFKSNPISVKINRVEEKEVDNSETFFTELNDEEKKQIKKNNEKYNIKKNNFLSVPLSYEFSNEQKKIDQFITESISKGKKFEEINSNLKYQEKDKK